MNELIEDSVCRGITSGYWLLLTRQHNAVIIAKTCLYFVIGSCILVYIRLHILCTHLLNYMIGTSLLEKSFPQRFH